jgi:hypothetical protein
VNASSTGLLLAEGAVTPFRADPSDAARLWQMSASVTGLPVELP